MQTTYVQVSQFQAHYSPSNPTQLSRHFSTFQNQQTFQINFPAATSWRPGSAFGTELDVITNNPDHYWPRIPSHCAAKKVPRRIAWNKRNPRHPRIVPDELADRPIHPVPPSIHVRPKKGAKMLQIVIRLKERSSEAKNEAMKRLARKREQLRKKVNTQLNWNSEREWAQLQESSPVEVSCIVYWYPIR